MKRKKILLVDDKNEFRKLMKIFLSKKYEVETAQNGLYALAILQNGNIPDIIISDLMMPEVGGKELVHNLKASGLFKNIPVIILSSIDKSNVRIELLEAGASDYIMKPFNPAELVVRIENILATIA